MITPRSAFSTLGHSSHRLSSQSEPSIWFDAQEYDGAEEFVLDESHPEDAQTSQFPDAPIVKTPSVFSAGTPSSQAESDSDSESDSGSILPSRANPDQSQDKVIVRRTQLPSPVVGDEGSLFAVLKKNVGKVSPRALSADFPYFVYRTLHK